MSHQVIAQPLPQDLRNWSFKGMNCEGWDFSRCDIRGCDFSRAKLAGADFSNVIAGRSQEQRVGDIKLAILLLPVAIILAPVVMLLSIGWILSAEFLAASGFQPFEPMPWRDNVPFTIAIAIALTIESMFVIPNTTLEAMLSFERGNIQDGLAWSVASVVILIMAFVMPYQAIKRFKTEPGTNFYSADLEGASFRNATLNNCNFDVACVKDVDWTNITG
jgi:hypothetical protein